MVTDEERVRYLIRQEKMSNSIKYNKSPERDLTPQIGTQNVFEHPNRMIISKVKYRIFVLPSNIPKQFSRKDWVFRLRSRLRRVFIPFAFTRFPRFASLADSPSLSIDLREGKELHSFQWNPSFLLSNFLPVQCAPSNSSIHL